MRTRAIRDLARLSDQEFLSEVSVGIRHVFNNSVRIKKDAFLLGEHKRSNGYRILLGIAEEEAAKILILLDAVRCPRQQQKQFSRQLWRFYRHLAKRIYAEACRWRASTFGELVSYIDQERQEFYLDGPNDVDWIFPNRILQNREGEMYVDYVDTDEGHLWFTPTDDSSGFLLTPTVLELVRALTVSGCTTPKALTTIAEMWRPISMTDDYHWTDLRDLNYATLKKLESQGLLQEQTQEVYRTIINNWSFPIYSAELEIAHVDQSELRDIQKHWPLDL